MVAYRITARSLERQLVGEHILKELASLEDCSMLAEPVSAEIPSSKVVFILEEEDEALAGAPRRTKKAAAQPPGLTAPRAP